MDGQKPEAKVFDRNRKQRYFLPLSKLQSTLQVLVKKDERVHTFWVQP